MQYYKVVDFLNAETIIHTDRSNYGQTLCNVGAHAHLLSLVIRHSSERDLPLDFFVTVNNLLANEGQAFIDKLPDPVNNLFALYDVSRTAHHKGKFISIDHLETFVQELTTEPLAFFWEGYYLWEFIAEIIRDVKHPDKPAREDSLFLFGNLDDCHYYMETHQKPGVIAKVDILEGNEPFRADMRMWDMVPNYATFRSTLAMFDLYWQGQSTDTPVFEYLFQGECRLSPL